ncbi:MAG: flippase [Anaerolineae bacterium]|nr:flippase [Anaerolineae bacterium]
MHEQLHYTVGRVTKNIVAQLFALAATTVSKLLITIVIGRLFGAERVGEFAFVMTFNLMFTFFATLGIPWALIREVATQHKLADHYVRTGLTLVAGAGILNIPLTVGIVLLLGRPANTCLAVGLASLALLFDGLAQTVSAVFNGYERMETAAVVTIIQEMVFLVIGTGVLILQLPFLWLFVVYVPSRLIAFLVSLFLYHKLLNAPLHFGWDRHIARELLQITWPFAANMALGSIYLRIDVVMLTLLHGNVAVGIYEAATNIFYRFNVFARMINNALMPLMAREFNSQAERITTYINVAVKYQSLLGIPLSVACVVLANPLIHILYGPKFTPSANIFAIMATIITLRFINNTLATALTASGLQSARSLAVALVAIFNIAVNVFILPAYSFTGAAITTILTEICFFGLLYVLLVQKVPQPLHFCLLFKPVLAGLGMALVLYLLSDLSLVLSLLLGGITYLVILFVTKTFSPQEVQIVLQIIRRNWDKFLRHKADKKPSADKRSCLYKSDI